jgi:hypothetical protein
VWKLILELGAKCPDLLPELGASVKKLGANSKRYSYFYFAMLGAINPELSGELRAN